MSWFSYNTKSKAVHLVPMAESELLIAKPFSSLNIVLDKDK